MSGVFRSGKWRIKPSGKLPIFLRFLINSSFTLKNAKKSGFRNTLPNRTYLNHMMYWPANEYEKLHEEVYNHLKNNDGWYEGYFKREMAKASKIFKLGLRFEKTDWLNKSNGQIEMEMRKMIQMYQESMCPWYAQYSLDEYFEAALEENLSKYLSYHDHNFRKNILIFSDPIKNTVVANERFNLLKICLGIVRKKESIKGLSKDTAKQVDQHIKKYGFISRGLGTSKTYDSGDIFIRIREIINKAKSEKELLDFLYTSSEQKIKNDYKYALNGIKPDQKFKRIIELSRINSFLRNSRVESFIFGDYGSSFMYTEIARRANFNPDWILEVTPEEMFEALKGKKMPSNGEMKKRLKNYAMVVKNGVTQLITDKKKIKALEKIYKVKVIKVLEITGKVACAGGIIKGRAKVCLDKSEIGKVGRGDILVAQFTTPDFVPAMEKAAAIVADQGGLSSHAAIVSRELGTPCIIGTRDGTRLIKDGDSLEVDASRGVIKILK